MFYFISILYLTQRDVLYQNYVTGCYHDHHHHHHHQQQQKHSDIHYSIPVGRTSVWVTRVGGNINIRTTAMFTLVYLCTIKKGKVRPITGVGVGKETR